MLTNENYFSRDNQMRYMGVSQFKAFEACPASALAEVRGEYERDKTTALLVGSYVDAYFEGTLPLFQAQHPEIFTKKLELKAEYRKAEDIIARIERDRLFMEFLGGDKQVILTGSINGVEVKIKVDSLHSDKIVDLKIMKDFQPIYKPEQGRLSWVEAWGYDLQGAVYQEIVRQNTGQTLPFYLAAATKEKTTDLDIVEVPQSYLDFELEHFKDSVQYYDSIKRGLIEPERCEHCDYCKETKVLKTPTKLDMLTLEGKQ